MALAFVIFTSGHSVYALTEYEGFLNPNEFVKWRVVQQVVQGEHTFTVFKNPDPDALIAKVETVLETVKQPNATPTFKLVAYCYTFGKTRNYFALKDGKYKKMREEKVPQADSVNPDDYREAQKVSTQA